MPTLAEAIVNGNAAGKNAYINFKGFALGNPYTDPESNSYGTYQTFWGHQLVSKFTWDAYISHCPLRPALCIQAKSQMNIEIGNLNPYALDYGVCASPALAGGRAQRNWLMHFITEKSMRGQLGVLQNLQAYDPCVDNYAIKYLNRPDVQAAIHAKPTVWRECSIKIVYNQSDSRNPMEPIYHFLIDQAKIRVLVYSGDDDSVCATVGTQEWIYKLGYNITQPWTAWTLPNDEQVAGYLTRFQGLNFATVHSAGHEVPTYQPARALQLWKYFLKGDF
jgi:carboxypeptidase C (cathepsin A)